MSTLDSSATALIASAPASSLAVSSSSWSSSRDLLSAIFPFLHFQTELMTNCIRVDKCWYEAAHRMASLRIEWLFPSSSALQELNASLSPFLSHLTRIHTGKITIGALRIVLSDLEKSTSRVKNIEEFRVHLVMDDSRGQLLDDWKETHTLTFPASLRTLEFYMAVAVTNPSNSLFDIVSTVLIRLSRQLKARNTLLETLKVGLKCYTTGDVNQPCSPPIEFLQNLSTLPALHTYETDSIQAVTKLSAEQFAVIRTFPALTRLKYLTDDSENGLTHAETLRALLPSESDTRQPLHFAILPFSVPPPVSSELAKVLTQYRWLRELELKTSTVSSTSSFYHSPAAADAISFLTTLSHLTKLTLIDSREIGRPGEEQPPSRLSGETLAVHIGAMVQLTQLHLKGFTITSDEMTRMVAKLTQLRILHLEAISGLSSLAFLPALSSSLCRFALWQRLLKHHSIQLAPSELIHILSLRRLETLQLRYAFSPRVPAHLIDQLSRSHPEFAYRSVPYLMAIHIC